jgi:hypothetical protein
LVGAAIALLHKEKPLRVIEYADQKVYLYDKFNGGISLGYYSHIDYDATKDKLGYMSYGFRTTLLHEAKGHGTQSKWLGPLYLPLIGLPSLIHCGIYVALGRKWNYYRFPTEKWADKIAGIRR